MATGAAPRQPGVTGDLDEATEAAKRKQIDVGQRRIVVYPASAAIASTYSHTAVLTLGSAAAMTLAAPVAADDGTVIEIVSASAQVHVITATGLVHDGVTGGAKGTMTCTGGFIGSSITLVAYNTKWYLLAKNVVAIT